MKYLNSDFSLCEYYYRVNYMSNGNSTLVPVEVGIPLHVADVESVAQSPLSPPESDATPEYTGNIFASLTPLQMAELCVERAKSYLEARDPMQASEKLYKATEESIRYLAEYYDLEQYKKAKSEKQWWSKLLAKASKELVRRTGRTDIDDAFTKAYNLHVFGFHENMYTVDDVKSVVPFVEKLVQYVREVSNVGRKDTCGGH